MRSLLGGLVLVAAVLLGGCGDEPPGEAAGEAGEAGESADGPRGPVAFELVEMLTETAVGGMTSPGGVPLADVTAVAEFTGQFDDDRMATRLVQLVDGLDVPDDQAAYAAVVDIGCNPPSEVTVTSTDTGIVIEPVKPGTKPVQCFAPATTVAVVLVDDSMVG